MNKIQVGLQSFGTIYGTVRNYDPQGNDIGVLNINGYSMFFVVRDAFGFNDVRVIFRKSTSGGGIAIPSGTSAPSGSTGNFTIAYTSNDTNINPGQYVYDLFADPTGASWGTTSQVKSIGSGIFEVQRGAKYGTF